MEKIMENLTLKRLFQEETILLPATSGKLNIKRLDVLFKVSFDKKFNNADLNKQQKPTKESIFEVYELRKDITFQEIFDSFEEDLNHLCLTQHQIVEFFKEHKNLLHPKWLTFFLFKEGGYFFIASARVRADALHVLVDDLKDSVVWCAGYRHRIVVPAINS